MTRFPALPAVVVHAPFRTSRLDAALEWTLVAVLGLRWAFEADADRFQRSDAAWKLQYGGSPLAGLYIAPHGLLEREDVTAVPPGHPEHRDADVLALVFWMGSRMEEHVAGAPRDAHGRFDPVGSEPEQRNWLASPVCEQWAWGLGEQLMGAEWPAHSARLRAEYDVLPTLDVDSAYAFIGKGAWRTGGAFGRDLLTGNWSRMVRRAKACAGAMADPYDTYARAAEWHGKQGWSPRWFFLLARFGSHDKGLPATSGKLSRLMQSLEAAHPGSVQWHPGYAAAADARRMEEEYRAFEAIMGRPPSASRQHYLRMVPGQTRRSLCALGIAEDHTEGHAVVTGFRGGFSRSRRWYDLERETLTPLQIHPFVAMDATLCRYMGMQPESAPAHLGGLADAVKEVGGTMRLLWHNESLSEEEGWTGWGAVYPNVLEAVR